VVGQSSNGDGVYGGEALLLSKVDGTGDCVVAHIVIKWPRRGRDRQKDGNQ
jgi:hypothetical protein